MGHPAACWLRTAGNVPLGPRASVSLAVRTLVHERGNGSLPIPPVVGTDPPLAHVRTNLNRLENPMSITNEDRYDLQQRANEVLGRKEGTTLMELLPPVGWADVATKRDIDALDPKFERIDDQFERVDDQFRRIDERIDARFDAFNASLQTDLRKMQGVLLSSMTALAVMITGILTITT